MTRERPFPKEVGILWCAKCHIGFPDGEECPVCTGKLPAAPSSPIEELKAKRAEQSIALILHRPDYRGDHSADVHEVIRVPRNTTVDQLLDITRRHKLYGLAWIEVKDEFSQTL